MTDVFLMRGALCKRLIAGLTERFGYFGAPKCEAFLNANKKNDINCEKLPCHRGIGRQKNIIINCVHTVGFFIGIKHTAGPYIPKYHGFSFQKTERINFQSITHTLPRHYHLGLPNISKSLPLGFYFFNRW